MTNETDDRLNLPICSIFHEMNQEVREAVVARALSSLHTVSDDRKREFQTLVKENIRGIKGFRDSSSAPGYMLKQPVSEKVMLSNDLACGIIALWIESHTKLKELVEAHLESAGALVNTLNWSDDHFQGLWKWDAFERELEAFGEKHPNIDRDDARLMLCCVSGKMPEDELEEEDRIEEEPIPEDIDRILAEALDYLKSLPFDAPEWVQEVPWFITSTIDIAAANEAKREMADGFDSRLSDLKSGFADLLEFFECETNSWTAANFLEHSLLPVAASLVSGLESLMAEYQVVHLPAPVMSEERERSLHRARLQEQILETLERMGEALASSNTTTLEQQPLPPPQRSQDSNHALAQEPVLNAEFPSMDTASPPESELDALAGDGGSVDHTAGVSSEEFESIQSSNLLLEQEKEDLEQKIKRLENELYESQQQEEGWRMAYHSYAESQKGVEDDINSEALGMDDVSKAVELATTRFRDRLLFQLNSDSTVEDNPFERPDQVWKALQWLATTYYDSRLGDIVVTDFDLSVREACSWWYKPSQGETTMTSYRNSYTTQLDGKTYWLKEHIGKGTNRDSRYTIRIAFDWDRERKAVVVGYIGRHQQTDQS